MKRVPPPPAPALVLVGRAEALAARGQLREALDLLERAIDASPQSAVAHLLKGRLIRRMPGGGQDLAGALRAFRRAIDASPITSSRRIEALKEYGLALVPIGRHREAAAAFEEAIALSLASAGAGTGPGRMSVGELADLASRALERAGETERALACLVGAEPFYREVRRDVGAFYVREAELLEKLGRYSELMACYARIVETDPDRVPIAGQRIEEPRVADPATRERLKRLLHGINLHLQAQPGDIVALIFKGCFFFPLGRYRQAAHVLERAIEVHEHFYARHVVGKVYLKMGRPVAALESLERARHLAPDYLDLDRDRALALELTERDQEALEAYRRIEARWPGRRDLVARGARLREKLGLLDEAYEGYLQAALIVTPPGGLPRAAVLGAWPTFAGGAWGGLGAPVASTASATMVPEVSRRQLLEKLAQLALRLGRPADARGHLDDALATYPDDPSLYLFRAAAKDGAGDAVAALDDLDGALALAAKRRDTFYREALLRKAELLVRKLGRPEDGVAAADRLLELDPGHVAALVVKGDGLKALRRFDESVACYARAADREVSEALTSEGERLYETADYAKALGKWNEAFRRNPRNWELYYHAAAAYACLGSAGPAAKYLEAAAKLNRSAIAFMEKDPDFDGVRGTNEVAEAVARVAGTAGPYAP